MTVKHVQCTRAVSISNENNVSTDKHMKTLSSTAYLFSLTCDVHNQLEHPISVLRSVSFRNHTHFGNETVLLYATVYHSWN